MEWRIEEVAEKQHTAARESIYSLSGMRQSNTQRGLNIIVNADGSVRKVLVK